MNDRTETSNYFDKRPCIECGNPRMNLWHDVGAGRTFTRKSTGEEVEGHDYVPEPPAESPTRP